MATRKRQTDGALTEEQVDALHAEYPAFVQRGSTEHRNLLGIDAPYTAPERVIELEKQLTIEPVIQDPTMAKKKPVTRENYRRFDEVMDGWYRKT